MNLINHGEMTKKIKGYLDSEEVTKVEVITEGKERELATITTIFGNAVEEPGYLGEFRKAAVGKNTLYYYDTTLLQKQKQISYVAVCEDDKPLFMISHSEDGNDDCRYSEQCISIYDRETKNLESRIKHNLLLVGDSAVLDVALIDKDMYGYWQKNYKFFYHDTSITAYQIEGDKFFNPDDSRLALAINKVETISTKIRNSVDETLGIRKDVVKEYKIKRKEDE